MFGTNINILIIFFCYMHSELTFYFFYNHFWVSSSLSQNRILQKQEVNQINPQHTVILIIMWVLVWVTKHFKSIGGNYSNINYFFIIFLIIVSISFLVISYWELSTGVTNTFVIYSIFNILYIMPYIVFVDCYLTLLFFLELYATLYYFFFLHNKTLDLTKHTAISKELFIYYLWNSFIVNALYGFGVVLYYLQLGSLKFSACAVVGVTEDHPFGLLILLSAISWKLGIPGFHFFKVELYKYLTTFSIFYFSILALIINIQFLLFIISLPSALMAITTYGFGIVVSLTTLAIIPQLFDSLTLYRFFAYSGVLTFMTICMMCF